MILLSIFFIIINYYLVFYIQKKINISSVFDRYVKSLKKLVKKKNFSNSSVLDQISKNGVKLLISLILILFPYFCLYFLLSNIFKMGLIYALLIPSISYILFLLKKRFD